MTDRLPRPLLAAVGALTEVRRLPAVLLTAPLTVLSAVDRARRSYEALVERGEQLVEDRFGDTEAGPVSAAPEHVVTESEKVLDAVSHVPDPLDVPHAHHVEPAPVTEDDAPLPDFDVMTLGALRGHLRGLSVEQVQELLDHERTHRSRPPVVALLERRLATLSLS